MQSEDAIEAILSECRRLEEKVSKMRKAIKILQDADSQAEEKPESVAKIEGALSVEMQSKKPLLRRISTSKVIINVLKNSAKPMDVSEITETINERYGAILTTNSISVALTRLKERDRVKEIPGTRPFKWILHKESL